MAMTDPGIIFGKVAHSRLRPVRNSFRYAIYYLALPLDEVKQSPTNSIPLAINHRGLLSFHEKDHGPMDGSPLAPWAKGILQSQGVTTADGPITLITMPRVLGYVFNPVSFWLCFDKSHGLRAVICEVHNTFGETHSYLCCNQDQSIIESNDTLFAKKLFHVSPLLKREGSYSFQFTVEKDNFAARINYRDADAAPTLTTSMVGSIAPLSKPNLRRAFWFYPLVTFKAITLIHWQALKLLVKGLPYQMKPEPRTSRISKTGNFPPDSNQTNTGSGQT